MHKWWWWWWVPPKDGWIIDLRVCYWLSTRDKRYPARSMNLFQATGQDVSECLHPDTAVMKGKREAVRKPADGMHQCIQYASTRYDT